MDANDINLMSVTIIDNNGNGYIASVKKEYIPIIIGILGEENPFYFNKDIVSMSAKELFGDDK